MQHQRAAIRKLCSVTRMRATGSPRAALIGAGVYAKATLVPALADAGLEVAVVASAGGVSAERLADRVAACGVDCIATDSIDSALGAARAHAGPAGRVLVFGSFHTVAAAMRAIGLRSS